MALGRADVFVGHDDAVRLGRLLAQEARAPFSSRSPEQRGRPFFFAVSTTVHAGAVTLAIFVTTVGLAPAGTTLRTDDPRETRLVFIATPGPGGGGGGGGVLQPTQPPKALREGRRQISSPAPVRKPPDEPIPVPAAPPDPTPPPLHSDPLPLLAAPIVAAPADARDRVGVLEEAREGPESRGSRPGWRGWNGRRNRPRTGHRFRHRTGLGRRHRGRAVPARLWNPGAAAAARGEGGLHGGRPATRHHR